jgi:hypothetical protein
VNDWRKVAIVLVVVVLLVAGVWLLGMPARARAQDIDPVVPDSEPTG